MIKKEMEEKFIAIKSKELSTLFEDRYVVVEKETGCELYNAGGSGCRTPQKAMDGYKSIVNNKALKSRFKQENGLVVAVSPIKKDVLKKEQIVLKNMLYSNNDDVFIFGRCQSNELDENKVDGKKSKGCVLIIKDGDKLFFAPKCVMYANEDELLLTYILRLLGTIDKNKKVHLIFDANKKYNSKKCKELFAKIEALALQRNITIQKDVMLNIAEEIKCYTNRPKELAKNYVKYEFNTKKNSTKQSTAANNRDAMMKDGLLTDAFTDDELLPDLSPVYGNFYVSDKRLSVNNLGTGKGKSYSYTKFVNKVIANDELDQTRKFSYATDRNVNVDAVYSDAIEDSSGMIDENKFMRIRASSDYIIDGYDILKQIESEPTIINNINRDNYNKLVETISLLAYNKKTTAKEMFMEKIQLCESQFRRECSRLLDKRCKEVGISKNDVSAKIELYETEYPLLAKLYPFANLYDARAYFFTVDKGLTVFDPVFDKQFELLSDGDFLSKAHVTLDESDANFERLLEKEAEKQAKVKLDLLHYSKRFYFGFKNIENFPSYMRNAKTLPKIEEYNKKGDELQIEYKFLNAFKSDLEQQRRWMFFETVNNIPHFKDGELFVTEDDDGAMVIGNNETPESYRVYEFVTELNAWFDSGLLIAKELCELYKKDQKDKYNKDCPSKDAASAVLGYLGIPQDDPNHTSIVQNILNFTKEEIDSEISNDFYLRQDPIISLTTAENDDLNIGVYRYVLLNTPERRIHNMTQHGQVAMFSATAWNNSVHRNFDFSWDKLKNCMYLPPEKEKKMEIEYAQSREKYKQDILVEDVCGNAYAKSFIENVFELDEDLDNCFSGLKDYEVKRAMKLLESMAKLFKNKKTASLCVVNVDIGKGVYKDRLENIFKKLEEKFNIAIHIVRADNIDDEMKMFRKNVLDGKISFFISSYGTVEKALNITIPYKYNTKTFNDEFYVLNDYGKEKISQMKENEEFEADFDGLYLENPTNIFPSLKAKTADEYTKQMLICFYIAGKLRLTKEISESQYQQIVKNIISGNEYPFRIDDFKYNKTRSFYAKKLAQIGQAAGRISRANIQKRNTLVLLDDEIKTFPANKTLKEYMYDDMYELSMETMSWKVKQVYNNILSGKKHSEKIHGVAIKTASQSASDYIFKALKTMHSEPERYQLLGTIKKYSLNKDEYDVLPKELKLMYKRIPGNSYSYSEYYKNGHSHIIPLEALPLTVGEVAITPNNLPITDNMKRRLETQGFSFDDSKDYKLLPPAFDKWKGNIGEAVIFGDYFKYNFQFKQLTAADFEKMDGYIELDFSIIAADPKLFKLMSVEYDKYDEKAKYFYDKCKDVSKRHNKPVLAMIVNAGYNESYLKEEVSRLYKLQEDDDMVWGFTVPNIYCNKDGFVDYSKIVKKEIGDRIVEFINKVTHK